MMTFRSHEGVGLLITITLGVALSSTGCAPTVTGGGGDPSEAHPVAVPSQAERGTLSAGGEHTCKLRADATIVCWGANDYGQLDAPSGEFVELSSGGLHSCARRADGTIACWGHMSNEPATAPPGSFVGLAAGNIGNCATRANGETVCWWTLNGALVSAIGPQEQLGALSVGGSQGCGQRADGTIGCWSLDAFGNFASGAALAAPSGTYKLVDAGGNSDGSWSCALGVDDSVSCWGDATVPGPVPAGAFATLSAGVGRHACALRLDGSVACWGDDSNGQSSPPAGTFVNVTTGWGHSCGTRSDGVVVCWGDDSKGQSTPAP